MPFASKRMKLSFWPLQLSGWCIYAVNSALTAIPVLHAHDYIAYRSVFLSSAFLASFAMYALCHALWHKETDLLIAVPCCLAVSLPLGVLCSVVTTWGEIHWGHASIPFRWGNVIAASTGSSFVLCTWSACYFGIKHYQALQAHQIQLAESRALARDAQLRALRYQLHPHFVFNTLNAISTVILDGESRVARQMLTKLAHFLRATLDCPNTDVVILREEIAIAEEYIALEQFRFGSRLLTTVDIDENAWDAMVPRLFLQPLIENAIKHGISKRNAGGRIAIKAYAKDHVLHVTMENDTPPQTIRTSSPIDGDIGVGLSNTRERLLHFYGSGASCLKTLLREDGIFEVSVTMSLDSRLGRGAQRREA
jgi:Histidine kinase